MEFTRISPIGGFNQLRTFVGSLYSAGRKKDLDDIDPTGNETILDEFRVGRKNLIITISVLEEGIDISACNVVICFDNLKSFVQRRGRARKQKLIFVAMLPIGDIDGIF
jgi:ERCC4-related helicase